MTRRRLLTTGGLMALAPAAKLTGEASPTPPRSERELWLDWVERVSAPVLDALQRRELRRTMPVEAVAGHEAERSVGTHLEAFARLLAGLAPWLELEPDSRETGRETKLRGRFLAAAQEALVSALDPRSPDYMRFGESGQTLVDSSFLSLGLLRAPKRLLGTLDGGTKARLMAALESERKILPPLNNWLLFAALNEALLRRLGGAWDRVRVDYALREHQSWYLGDGVYGDGPHYHADYYNSYVIHPYLLALAGELADEPVMHGNAPAIVNRARRYAVLQERSIGSNGEFPAIGRSIAYRAGAFHLLADVALRRMLPDQLAPGVVRSALTAVQQRTLSPVGTFSAQGWLRIGLAGHQPSLGETYISTGSLYLCSAAWLPLGLPASDPFWTAEPGDWTQKRIWAGLDVQADHALAE